jgi:hypothetical protein
MEKLKQTQRFITYRQEKAPQAKSSFETYILRFVSDFLGYITDLIRWIEDDVYKNIVLRVNWLLTITVEDHTADNTLNAAETRSIHTNKGASGAVTLTLPTVTYAGIEFTFAVQAAQELRIDPGSAAILDDSGVTADKYKTANAVGECLKLVSNSEGNWYVISKYGTWTEEP